MEELYLQDVFLELVPTAETRHLAPSVTPDAILEVLELPVNGESVYAFELRAGSTLSFAISADQAVDLLLCTFEAYEAWLESDALEPEILAIETHHAVKSAILAIRSERSVHLAVLVTNSSGLPAHALVEARS
jgi:hypothetical protein